MLGLAACRMSIVIILIAVVRESCVLVVIEQACRCQQLARGHHKPLQQPASRDEREARVVAHVAVCTHSVAHLLAHRLTALV